MAPATEREDRYYAPPGRAPHRCDNAREVLGRMVIVIFNEAVTLWRSGGAPFVLKETVQ